MIKVLLAGEGRHDIGDSRTPGVVEWYVRKLAGDQVEFEFETARIANMPKTPGKPKHHYGLKGDGLRAYRGYHAAQRHGADLFIMIRDSDKPTTSADERRIQMQAGIDRAKELGCDGPAAIPVVAIRTIEAWLVADLGAFSKAFGVDVSSAFPKGRKPEDLWGSRDGLSSNHPKTVCNTLFRIAGRHDCLEERLAVIDCVDLELLKSRCPDGFAPFADAMTTFVAGFAIELEDAVAE